MRTERLMGRRRRRRRSISCVLGDIPRWRKYQASVSEGPPCHFCCGSLPLWGETSESGTACRFCGAVLRGDDDYSGDVGDGGDSYAIYPASGAPGGRRVLRGGGHVKAGIAARQHWRNRSPPRDTPAADRGLPRSCGLGHRHRRRRPGCRRGPDPIQNGNRGDHTRSGYQPGGGPPSA